MAKKKKEKSKSIKVAARPSKAAKSLILKAKPAKPAKSAVRKPAKAKVAKPARRSSKPPSKVASRVAPAPKKSTKKIANTIAKKTTKKITKKAAPARHAPPVERVRSKQFASAVQAYEAGLKLMHAEDYDRARRCFEKLVNEYSDESEIQGRAKVLIHACEIKKQEHGRKVLRSADDHYNVGIGDLNRRELQSAIQHLQQALKIAPKADHVLYALAAANALQGNRDQALIYLKQSIQHRMENRFQAVRDNDFLTLSEDPDFKQLVTPSER